MGRAMGPHAFGTSHPWPTMHSEVCTRQGDGPPCIRNQPSTAHYAFGGVHRQGDGSPCIRNQPSMAHYAFGAPGGPRRPQEAPGHPRRPQDAPGGPRTPGVPNLDSGTCPDLPESFKMYVARVQFFNLPRTASQFWVFGVPQPPQPAQPAPEPKTLIFLMFFFKENATMPQPDIRICAHLSAKMRVEPTGVVTTWQKR